MPESFKNRLFITGTLRSGTTLVDKLLNSHPSLTVASQPFFRLFTCVKEKYYQENNIESLPLSPHFCEPPYLRQNLGHYLKNMVLNDSGISCLKECIPQINRKWSPGITSEKLAGLQSGSFFHILEQCMNIINETYGTNKTKIAGIKEVLCEEFAPVLLENGYKCIIVIRDPRAAISSASTGRFEKYVGKTRPVLLNIRNWRKSAAYAVSLRSNPDFCLLKYEEIVCSPEKTLTRISNFLGVETFGKGFSLDILKDQEGSPWKGNSSYGDMNGVKNDSLNKWKENLSEEEISLIEYCCLSEMIYLDYDLIFNPEITIIDRFKETRTQERVNYATTHYLDDINRAREKERFSYLLGKALPSERAIYDYFFSPEVWRVLRTSLIQKLHN